MFLLDDLQCDSPAQLCESSWLSLCVFYGVGVMHLLALFPGKDPPSKQSCLFLWDVLLLEERDKNQVHGISHGRNRSTVGQVYQVWT